MPPTGSGSVPLPSSRNGSGYIRQSRKHPLLHVWLPACPPARQRLPVVGLLPLPASHHVIIDHAAAACCDRQSRLVTCPCPVPACIAGCPCLCRFGKQYDKEGAYIRHFLPALKVCCGCRRSTSCSALGCQPASGDIAAVAGAEDCASTRPTCLHLPLPPLQDRPAKYIFEPWTAPLAVQQAAGCIIGKDYPQ